MSTLRGTGCKGAKKKTDAHATPAIGIGSGIGTTEDGS